MKKIGIITKDIPAAHKAAGKLITWLEKRRKQVFIDRETAAATTGIGYDRAEIPSLVDMIIVLGGDGTLCSR